MRDRIESNYRPITVFIRKEIRRALEMGWWIQALIPWSLGILLGWQGWAGYVDLFVHHGLEAYVWESFKWPQSPGNMIWVRGSVDSRGRTGSACSQRRCLQRLRKGKSSQSGTGSRWGQFPRRKDDGALTQKDWGRREPDLSEGKG